MSFAIVLAGGGERVVAWELGVLAGLADGGVDARRAGVVLGTSAGALVGARLAAGLDPRDDAGRIRASRDRDTGGRRAFAALAAAWEPAGRTPAERRRAFGRLALERSPGGAEAAVERVAARLSAGWPPSLRVAAIDALSGERVVFDAGSGVPLARAVAASRAVPTLRAPVEIAGGRYIDGALGSATNADALAGTASLIVVVTAVPAQNAEGVERLWLAALLDEVTDLEHAGHEVVVIHASPEDRAAMGPDPMSGATAPSAMAAGHARGWAAAGQISPRRAA
jgi:NTE family protein